MERKSPRPRAIGLGQQDPRAGTINWLTLLNHWKVHWLILYLFICKYLLTPLAKQLFSPLTEKKRTEYENGAPDGLWDTLEHLVGGLVPLLCGLSHSQDCDWNPYQGISIISCRVNSPSSKQVWASEGSYWLKTLCHQNNIYANRGHPHTVSTSWLSF